MVIINHRQDTDIIHEMESQKRLLEAAVNGQSFIVFMAPRNPDEVEGAAEPVELSETDQSLVPIILEARKLDTKEIIKALGERDRDRKSALVYCAQLVKRLAINQIESGISIRSDYLKIGYKNLPKINDLIKSVLEQSKDKEQYE
jgi:hypothetical protein